jgi:hypothetical protein
MGHRQKMDIRRHRITAHNNAGKFRDAVVGEALT